MLFRGDYYPEAEQRREQARLLAHYSDACAAHGVGSPEAMKIRQDNAGDAEFMRLAEVSDTLRMDALNPKIHAFKRQLSDYASAVFYGQASKAQEMRRKLVGDERFNIAADAIDRCVREFPVIAVRTVASAPAP